MRSFLFTFTLLITLVLCLSTADARMSRMSRNHKPSALKSSKSKGSSSNSNPNSNSTADASASSTSDSSNSTDTGVVAGQSRKRPCDQGDQSLAAGMQANVVIGLGMQAAVQTLQNLLSTNGKDDDIQDGMTRLQQFMNTSVAQLQMAVGIADDDSFAQPQLATLQSDLDSQTKLFSTLTGKASDNSTLSKLLDSFQTSTGTSQDAVTNALVDCFLPIATVSG